VLATGRVIANPRRFRWIPLLVHIEQTGINALPIVSLISFLVGGPSPGQFSVRRSENFDISDAVLLSPGDLLILERKFSLLNGVGIRIRRLALAADIMDHRLFRPHGKQRRKIIDSVRPQPEPRRFDNWYIHYLLRPSNFLTFTSPGSKPSTQRILIDAMATPFGAFASP